MICFCVSLSKTFTSTSTGRTLTGLYFSFAWGSFSLWIGVESANLRLDGIFLELAKDLFTSDINVPTEHSNEIFKIFNGIVWKGVALLLLI